MTYVETLDKAFPDPKLYGGKGSNLIKMVNLGIRVPPGFIVNTNAFNKFIKDILNFLYFPKFRNPKISTSSSKELKLIQLVYHGQVYTDIKVITKKRCFI